MKLLIPTCNQNLWLIPLYEHLFKKYELGKVFEPIFLGFTHPNEFGIEVGNFVSMGEIQICWSHHIYDYLNSILDDFICFTLEDFLPVSTVNLESFNRLLSYTLTNNVGRADLTWDLATNCKIVPTNTTDIYKSIKGKMVEGDSLYRISTQTSLWKSEYLMRFLKNEWTPWDFEVSGSHLSLKYDEEIICLNTKFELYPTKWTPKGAVSRVQPGKFNCLGMDIGTIREIVEMGFVEEKDLIWGMWKGSPVTFEQGGGYNFKVENMPRHQASPSNWQEWKHVYE